MLNHWNDNKRYTFTMQCYIKCKEKYILLYVVIVSSNKPLNMIDQIIHLCVEQSSADVESKNITYIII